MDREREIEFFDHFASAYGDYDVLGHDGYRRLTDMFESCVKPLPGQRCLDLGCGTGAFTAVLRRFNLDLVGIDISPISIERAKATAKEERYVVGDITKTGLPSDGQDIVVYSGVLHHFPTQAERARVLNEGMRLLAPGGTLFSYDPNAHSPSMLLYRDPRSPFYSSKGKTENEVLLRRDELALELREAGFEAIAIRGVGGITFRFVMSGRARGILRLYNFYEKMLKRSPFENRLGTFLVCTAKKSVRFYSDGSETSPFR